MNLNAAYEEQKARAEKAEAERDSAKDKLLFNMARAGRAEAERDALREGLKRALLSDEQGATVLDAMARWPTGASGPIAIAAYESLIRRLRALLFSTSEGMAARTAYFPEKSSDEHATEQTEE